FLASGERLPDPRALDPILPELEDFQAVRADLQAYRTVRQALQGLGDQTVEGLGALAGQVPAEQLVQLADVGATLDDLAAVVLGLDLGMLLLILAAEVADYLFQHVYQSDQALHVAVLVLHQAHAPL